MPRSVPIWVGKTLDSAPPPRVRLRVFQAKGGKCHRCGRKIRAGEKWTLEHVAAICNGGANIESNLDCTCSNCLPEKNAQDVAEKSAVAEIAKKHLGLTKPKKPFPQRKDPWGKMRDPRDTAEFHVEYAAHDVRRSVAHIVNLAKQFPHLVRQELPELSNANDDLAELVAKLTVAEAAE